MTENYWDPLLEHSEDEGIIAAAKKRQIKNILKSYVSGYSPLIQPNFLSAENKFI